MKQLQQNGRDLSQRLVIWRNIEKINQDSQFVKDVQRTAKPMCKEIADYPLGLDLNGDFETVVERIRRAVPMELFSDVFRVGEYTHNNGRMQEHLGTGVMRDFIRQEKEKLYAKTEGRISDHIVLEKDAFLNSVKVKDPFALLEAVHNFFIVLKHNPESRQRCKSLFTFADGQLIVGPDVDQKVEGMHSLLASPDQVEVYQAVREHIEALRALEAPDAFAMALKSDPEDLRWLNLTNGITANFSAKQL